jgi:hypothetical protein
MGVATARDGEAPELRSIASSPSTDFYTLDRRMRGTKRNGPPIPIEGPFQMALRNRDALSDATKATCPGGVKRLAGGGPWRGVLLRGVTVLVGGVILACDVT